MSSPPLFLLAGDGLCRAFAGTRVGVGPLTTHRQVTAVTQATVATKVHQTLDVHLCLTAQVAFDGQVGVDVLSGSQNFGVREFVHTTASVDAERLRRWLWRKCCQYR